MCVWSGAGVGAEQEGVGLREREGQAGKGWMGMDKHGSKHHQTAV